MSILISTLFPLVLSGALPPLEPATPAVPAPSVAVAAPKPVAPPAAIPVVATTPAPIATPVAPPIASPVIAPPAAAPEPVRINAPEPAPAPQTPVALSGADRDAIIARVGKALSDTRTAQGRFTQIDPWGQVSTGAFQISRPGRVRFEYVTPEPIYIISDGVSVSIEEPKRQSWDSAPLASTPLHLFLRSNVDLQRDGSVTNVATRNGSHYVTLEDRTGEAEGRMILEFRASDFELMGWVTIDGAGGETAVRLADVETNISLRPALFVVRDPYSADDRRR